MESDFLVRSHPLRMACEEPVSAYLFKIYFLKIAHRIVAVIGTAARVAAHRWFVVFLYYIYRGLKIMQPLIVKQLLARF